MAIPAKPSNFQCFFVIRMMGFHGYFSTASRTDLWPLDVARVNAVVDGVASTHFLPMLGSEYL